MADPKLIEAIDGSIKKWSKNGKPIRFKKIDTFITWFDKIGDKRCPMCYYHGYKPDISNPTCSECEVHNCEAACCEEFFEVNMFYYQDCDSNELNKAMSDMYDHLLAVKQRILEA